MSRLKLPTEYLVNTGNSKRKCTVSNANEWMNDSFTKFKLDIWISSHIWNIRGCLVAFFPWKKWNHWQVNLI